MRGGWWVFERGRASEGWVWEQPTRGSEKDKKLKLEGLKKRSKKPTRPEQRPTVNNSKTRFRKTKRSLRAMELN